MDFDKRSRESRARAEHALVELAIAFGEHAQELVVIGGLNPDFLAPAAPVPHLGTTDVDILLELGFVYDREDLNFSWLATALDDAGFKPKNLDAWQWTKADEESVIRIDILCDVQDSPDQTMALPGTMDVSAKNLAGPSGALATPIERRIPLDERSRAAHPDADDDVLLRFASLGGYLLAKSSACVARSLVKDAYDLMYVVLYNEGGPDGAADAMNTALIDGPLHHDHQTDAESALLRFIENDDFGGWFADQMQAAGDASSLSQLKADARLGATRALNRLKANKA